MTGQRTNSGARLQKEWQIPAKQVRYHKDGVWFMPLERFPGAFCDPDGYVVFATQRDYENSRYLSIGDRVNVRTGVSRIPGYVRAR
jgi:hypothetical protein